MKTLILFLSTLVIFAGVIVAQPSNNSSSTANSATGKKSFRPTKSQITEAQNKLKSAGTYSGATDGKYNDDFRASLKSFQEKNSLEKSGKLDEPTIVKMGIALSDSQKGIESNTGAKTTRTTFRASKAQISTAQEKLKTGGSYNGTATGKYDDDFRSAIKAFQGNNGLAKSGSLNRSTLEKMGIKLTDSQLAIPTNPTELSSGDAAETPAKRGPVFRASKEQIIQAQQKLKAAGHFSGEETGTLTDETRAALKLWQKQNGVKETGTLNKITLEAMKIELTDKQKAM